MVTLISTAIMSFRIFDLPSELLVPILSFLSNEDLHNAGQASFILLEVIDSSVELQYLKTLRVAQMADNPSSHIPIVDRLAALTARESAFLRVKPSWKRSYVVNFMPAGLYELSAGLFFLGEFTRKALRYIKLPTQPAQDHEPSVEWERIETKSENAIIIDFGLAIEEHDLIVMATFNLTEPFEELRDNMPLKGEIQLEFLSLSTREPHPQARESITVQQSLWGLPNVVLEIVGDHVLFAVSYAHEEGPNDNVYFYEWRTRRLVKIITAERRTYFGAVFLSTDVVLLPNTSAATLELWQISSNEDTPALTLHLPRVVPGVQLRLMTARGEPNPSALPLRKDPYTPFSTSSENSIIVFHVSFPMHRFLLFIHRRALLSLIDKHPEPANDPLPYSEWGPNVCRWLNAAGLNTDWITTTSGQRCVLLPMRPSPFFLLDFNPLNEPVGPSARRLPADNDPFSMDHGIWAETVGSRLECHVAGGNQQFTGYSGASLDDSRIIALRVSCLPLLSVFVC
ncbi:hypothetical protein FB45DRAFT_41712 [Roridomyces roridus]|uniref:F-box domain-containing protein n=1 Tax=Roridomyces roridus TaxID=1738132 RepID=A0AAD7BRE6_9AGAR|nr:hypothetical protein FB45DRAFT_41712 [Roridomyces roridus]